MSSASVVLEAGHDRLTAALKSPNGSWLRLARLARRPLSEAVLRPSLRHACTCSWLRLNTHGRESNEGHNRILCAGARVKDAPPQLKQPFAKAFQAARAAGAEPEWRPAAQPSEHLAYFVGTAGVQGPVVIREGIIPHHDGGGLGLGMGSALGDEYLDLACHAYVMLADGASAVSPSFPLVSVVPLPTSQVSQQRCYGIASNLLPADCTAVHCRRRHLRRVGRQGAAACPARRHSLQAGAAGHPGCCDAALPGRRQHSGLLRYKSFMLQVFFVIVSSRPSKRFVTEHSSPSNRVVTEHSSPQRWLQTCSLAQASCRNLTTRTHGDADVHSALSTSRRGAAKHRGGEPGGVRAAGGAGNDGPPEAGAGTAVGGDRAAQCAAAVTGQRPGLAHAENHRSGSNC